MASKHSVTSYQNISPLSSTSISNSPWSSEDDIDDQLKISAKLNSFNYDQMDLPIKISNNEFVMRIRISDDNKLILFNSITKSWSEFYTNSEFEWPSYCISSYDKENNKYYVISGYHTIFEIDINSKQSIKHHHMPFSGLKAVCVLINDKLHIIGGALSNNHLIFDTKTKQFIQHYIFHELRTLMSPGLIYVKSKQFLYLIGGYNESPDNTGDNLSESESDSNDNDNGFGYLDKIWKYSINDKKWEYLLITLPQTPSEVYPYFLTTNERYIVVMLPLIPFGKHRCFYYLDLEDESKGFIQSLYKLSFSGVYIEYAVMTGNKDRDRLCVYGYMRSIRMPYSDILEIIVEFYNESVVHLFEREFDSEMFKLKCWNHLIVNISDIIPSY
eukprot:29566_1